MPGDLYLVSSGVIKMNNELEKRLAMISGKSPDEYDVQLLSDIDRQQITDAIEMLFSGLTLSSWLTGGTLGKAWRDGYNYIRDFVYKMPSDNSVVVYLKQITVSYLSRWDFMIVSSNNFNDLIKCPDDQKEEWNARANWQINEGQNIILTKIAKFKAGGVAPKQPVANQKVVESLAREMMEKERVNQREERSRTCT